MTTTAQTAYDTAILANQNVATLANLVDMPRTSVEAASAAAMGTLAAHAALKGHTITGR